MTDFLMYRGRVVGETPSSAGTLIWGAVAATAVNPMFPSRLAVVHARPPGDVYKRHVWPLATKVIVHRRPMMRRTRGVHMVEVHARIGRGCRCGRRPLNGRRSVASQPLGTLLVPAIDLRVADFGKCICREVGRERHAGDWVLQPPVAHCILNKGYMLLWSEQDL